MYGMTLPCSGCGVEEIEDYRIEVLSYARRLERLDKDPFTDDERQEAEEVSARFCSLLVHGSISELMPSIYVTQLLGFPGC